MNYSIDWDGPGERDRDPEEYELLRNRLAYALGGLRAVAAEAKDKKLSSIYGVAQGALDLAERGEQACAEMRGDTPMGPDAARMEFVDRISGTVDPGSEADRLRTALQEIAGQNDLYGYTEADRPSAAYAALHKCELIARAALEDQS